MCHHSRSPWLPSLTACSTVDESGRSRLLWSILPTRRRPSGSANSDAQLRANVFSLLFMRINHGLLRSEPGRMTPLQNAETLQSESRTGPDSIDRCPNCGADTVGPYCHACGQRRTSNVVPMRQLIGEALDNVLSLDNRLFRTVRILVSRPGSLTQLYLDGRRVSYVSPFRLYLLSSILYFFVASFVGTSNFGLMKFDADGEETALFAEILPRIMFVIVPAFALLLMGLFRRIRSLYAEHLIFTLHVHAFWYIAFTLSALLEPVTDRAVEDGNFTAVTIFAIVLAVVVQAAVPVYLFLSMRWFYGQSRGKTFLRMMLLFVGYFVLLGGAVYLFYRFIR